MTHKGKILWIPAEREYKVVCEECGEMLIEDVNGLRFDVAGECEGPDDALGIQVEDGVGTKDHFGGAPLKP